MSKGSVQNTDYPTILVLGAAGGPKTTFAPPTSSWTLEIGLKDACVLLQRTC